MFVVWGIFLFKVSIFYGMNDDNIGSCKKNIIKLGM